VHTAAEHATSLNAAIGYSCSAFASHATDPLFSVLSSGAAAVLAAARGGGEGGAACTAA
jgi:hypothetical protein